MLDIWWRYLKTRKQKPWGNMQGHKACNQQPSHESNKETPTLPPSHLLTKSIQVSFSFTIWPQCASKVVPPARSPQKVISKTSFIFLKCSGSQFSGDFGFKFASFFFGFSGARGGTQRFPWNFRVFLEKASASPFGEKFFGGFGCTWLERNFAKKDLGGAFFSDSKLHPFIPSSLLKPPTILIVSTFFNSQLSTEKKSRVKNLQCLSLNTPPPKQKKDSFQHVSTPPFLAADRPTRSLFQVEEKLWFAPPWRSFSRRWEGALDVATYWWKMFSSY